MCHFEMRFVFKILTKNGTKLEYGITAVSKKLADKKIKKALKGIGEYKIIEIEVEEIKEKYLDLKA